MDNLANIELSAGAYWKLINNEEADEVDSLDDLIDGIQFRAPTIPEGESNHNGPKKRNYSLDFDRPPFIETTLLPKLDSQCCYI